MTGGVRMGIKRTLLILNLGISSYLNHVRLLFGQVKGTIIINTVFVIFIVFFTFFLSIIFFLQIKKNLLRKIIQIIMIIITGMGIKKTLLILNLKASSYLSYIWPLFSQTEDIIINRAFVIFIIIFILFYLLFFLQIKKKTFGKIIQIIMIVMTGRAGVGIKRPFQVVFKLYLSYI